MRMAVFHPAFELVRGAEILAATQAGFYRGQGVALDLVTLGYDPGRWASRLDGIPVRKVQKRHWTDLFLGNGQVGKLRVRGNRAADVLKDYDLVVAHNFPANAMLGAARIQARKIWQCNEPPRSLHWRDANPYLASRPPMSPGVEIPDALQAFTRDLVSYDRAMVAKTSPWGRRTYDLESAKGLDLIYGISEFSRDNARRIYGRCRDEVIYPLVRFPEGGWRRSGLNRLVRRVLVHSRLEALKNIDTVIRGFHRFRGSSPVPCELHIVGEGPWRARLESLALSLCPDGEVKFHGYLPEAELRGVYEACDVFALLPVDEPFGMVFPEAAAKGLLLVGSDHGGPMEILDGGRLGWTIDAFSPEALCEVLQRIWSSGDAEIDQRREAADRACLSRFSLSAIGPQLMVLLRAV